MSRGEGFQDVRPRKDGDGDVPVLIGRHLLLLEKGAQALCRAAAVDGCGQGAVPREGESSLEWSSGRRAEGHAQGDLASQLENDGSRGLIRQRDSLRRKREICPPGDVEGCLNRLGKEHPSLTVA